MFRTAFRLFVAAALLLAPSLAFAHPGHGVEAGFAAGFIHPFSGIDHLMAMTAVGLLAAHLGGRALWAVPASFVTVMGLGGLMGASGTALPFAETAIALSVLVFGVMIFARLAIPTVAAMALVGAFAVFHGYAHGVEMPLNGSGELFGCGFLSATALLHGFGIALGLAIGALDLTARRRVTQACGAVLGVVGAGLLIGLI